MKKLISIGFLILSQLISIAQEKQITSKKSIVKHISFKKNSSENYIKTIPSIKISDLQFADENNDSLIEAGESAFIRFNLSNTGYGLAKNVRLVNSIQSSINPGLEFEREIELGDIFSKKDVQVSITLTGRSDLVSGIIQFRIDILDDDKTNPDPLELEIATKKSLQPNVLVANSAFYVDSAQQIASGKQFYLRTLIQNVGGATATEVQAEFLLPPGCSPVGSSNKFFLDQLKKGEFVEVEFPFMVSNDYNQSMVQIVIVVKEKLDLFPEQKTLILNLLEKLPSKEGIQLVPFEIKNSERNDSILQELYLSPVGKTKNSMIMRVNSAFAPK